MSYTLPNLSVLTNQCSVDSKTVYTYQHVYHVSVIYFLTPVPYSFYDRTKCIGITIETRPDYCLKPHLNEMLSYGCTRIEIGVQSIYEDVARDTNRGHTVAAVCNSFQLAKDCGFKVIQLCFSRSRRAPE